VNEPTSVPSVVNMLTLYLFPAATSCVIVKVSLPPGATVSEVPDDQVLAVAPLTFIRLTVTSLVPELVTATAIRPLVASPTVKVIWVTVSSLVSMNPMVSEPIQAATAMETATVTAMSMIAATTGLKAFLLFRSFLIFGSFPPCECIRELTTNEI
jgi:hypothetical protein